MQVGEAAATLRRALGSVRQRQAQRARADRSAHDPGRERARRARRRRRHHAPARRRARAVHRLSRRLVPAVALPHDVRRHPRRRRGKRIVLVEDASDAVDLADVKTFANSEGAPPGADPARVLEDRSAFKSASQDCGRDDRGQETAIDVGAALTLAPLRADRSWPYDDVCSSGNDGTGALARALEHDPSAIVFPFSVGPVRTSGVAATYGLTPLPFLEAIVRGIPHRRGSRRRRRLRLSRSRDRAAGGRRGRASCRS